MTNTNAKKNAGFMLLTSGGLGHMRPFSGTWGSLPPVVLAGLLVLVGQGPATSPVLFNGVLVIVLLVFSLACVRWGDQAEARFGRKDPGQVVADETAGQCIPLFGLPLGADDSLVRAGVLLGAAFVLFRLFDIVKPPPCNGLQKYPSGWGILLDDLMAGVYALIVLQVAVALI